MPQVRDVAGQAITVTTTATKVTRSTMQGKAGYRLKQIGAGAISIAEIESGGTAPTFTDMVTNGKTSWPNLTVGDVLLSEAQDPVDVYLCCAAGTVTAWFEDLS